MWLLTTILNSIKSKLSKSSKFVYLCWDWWHRVLQKHGRLRKPVHRRECNIFTASRTSFVKRVERRASKSGNSFRSETENGCIGAPETARPRKVMHGYQSRSFSGFAVAPRPSLLKKPKKKEKSYLVWTRFQWDTWRLLITQNLKGSVLGKPTQTTYCV